MTINLWIAIPVYNESKALYPLLKRLLALGVENEFNVIFCDNGSTDDSLYMIESFISTYKTQWVIVEEPQKGTGAAADTAIREAIDLGATHVARTDADCLPDYNWIRVIKQHFLESDLLLLTGKITARMDDTKISQKDAKKFNQVVPVAAWFGKLRPLNKSKEYKGPYVMTAGCNVAIESGLYLKSGGFPRTKIEDVHEDHILINRVRKITDKYAYVKDMHVEVSARRIEKWGIVNTLKWYANHSYKPEITDIR